MGIRTKLLAPLLTAWLLLAMGGHFLWIPSIMKHEREIIASRESRLIGAITPTLAIQVALGDSQAVFESLSLHTRSRSSGWRQVKVTGADGKVIWQNPPGPVVFDTQHLIRFEETLMWQGKPTGTLHVVVDWSDEYREQMYRVVRFELWALLGLGIISLVAVFWQDRSIRVPVLKLRDVANELAKGNVATALPPPRKDELGQLSAAFSYMRDNIRFSRAALQRTADRAVRSEKEHRAVVHTMADALLTLDENGDILSTNPAGEKMFGVRKEQMLGQPVDLFIPGCLSPSALGLIHEYLAQSQTPTPPKLEVEGRRVDGQSIWLAFSASVLGNSESPSYVIVLTDITAERDAQEALHQSIRLKDEFMAAMSHELRTPLNAILGLSEALEEGVYGVLNSDQSHALTTINDSGRHLLELVNDVLDLSKIEAQKLELNIQPLAISDLVAQVIRIVQPKIERQRIHFEHELILADGQSETLEADARRLRQIMLNLLDNAIKFTPEGGSVSLRVEVLASPAIAEFVVKDTGIGIPEHQLEKIFEPFTQVDRSLSRHYEGTGLGLSLVHRLTLLHHGEVDIHSEEGTGTTVSVVLPLEQPAGHGADQQSQEQPATIAQITVPAPADKTTILLVDDNPANIDHVQQYLRRIGYTVDIATSGADGMRMAQSLHPTAILMDVQMPDIDGLEVIRRLRSIDGFEHTPIIAVTALAMDGDRDRCLAAGATDYLSKPFSLKSLSALLAEYAKKSA